MKYEGEMRPVGDGARPALTIGLPVFNGEEYLAEALDGLLGQTFEDFELIISDNASTDSTGAICRDYARRDRRIRYVRQPHNVGAGPNHNLLVPLASAPLFKWASHDDVYEPRLVERCVEMLGRHPEVVLVNVADGLIDDQGSVIDRPPYPLDSESPSPRRRLRSLLMEDGGNDFYGVIRTDVLRAVRPHNSYPHADRVFMAELILAGPWRQVPEVLFFRREHPDRASHAGSVRRVCVQLEPRRANRWRYPLLLLYIEYLLGFFTAVARAPISSREKLRCYYEVARWLTSRAQPSRARRLLTRGGTTGTGIGASS